MDTHADGARQYEPTYRMKPHDDKKFSSTAVQRICAEVVEAELKHKTWNGEEEGILTVGLTDTITQRVKALGFDRYKLMVQVVLGENRQQGVRVASRCLWDTDTDNYASYSYKNDTMWCTAMVFGMYTE